MAGKEVPKEVVESFKEFCKLAGSKDATQMTPKANGKLVTDAFEKDYKAYGVKAICDASVFPACKEPGKPHMVVNGEKVQKYLSKTAHEIAKKKHKDTKMSAEDPKVQEVMDHLCQLCISCGPKVKTVKQSATGNVSGLTDVKGYTGAHKERFDAEGKGKGKDGRVDKADDSGYVGNYKGAGTFDKKK